jgi:hypothetical protein
MIWAASSTVFISTSALQSEHQAGGISSPRLLMMNVRSVSTAKVVMRLGFLTGAVPGQDFIDLKF